MTQQSTADGPYWVQNDATKAWRGPYNSEAVAMAAAEQEAGLTRNDASVWQGTEAKRQHTGYVATRED